MEDCSVNEAEQRLGPHRHNIEYCALDRSLMTARITVGARLCSAALSGTAWVRRRVKPPSPGRPSIRPGHIATLAAGQDSALECPCAFAGLRRALPLPRVPSLGKDGQKHPPPRGARCWRCLPPTSTSATGTCGAEPPTRSDLLVYLVCMHFRVGWSALRRRNVMPMPLAESQILSRSGDSSRGEGKASRTALTTAVRHLH